MSRFYRALETAREIMPFDLAFELSHDFASKVAKGNAGAFERSHEVFMARSGIPECSPIPEGIAREVYTLARVYSFLRSYGAGVGQSLRIARSFAPMFEAKEAKARGIASVELV